MTAGASFANIPTEINKELITEINLILMIFPFLKFNIFNLYQPKIKAITVNRKKKVD